MKLFDLCISLQYKKLNAVVFRCLSYDVGEVYETGLFGDFEAVFDAGVSLDLSRQFDLLSRTCSIGIPPRLFPAFLIEKSFVKTMLRLDSFEAT